MREKISTGFKTDTVFQSIRLHPLLNFWFKGPHIILIFIENSISAFRNP